jgi:hypothetical protein
VLVSLGLLRFSLARFRFRFCKPLSMHPARPRHEENRGRDCIRDTTPGGKKRYRELGTACEMVKEWGGTRFLLLDALFDKGADHGLDLGSRVGRDHVCCERELVTSTRAERKCGERGRAVPRAVGSRSFTSSCKFGGSCPRAFSGAKNTRTHKGTLRRQRAIVGRQVQEKTSVSHLEQGRGPGLPTPPRRVCSVALP